MTQFVETWVKIATRYENNHNVFALGLFNEFQGGESEGKYWSEMMSQAINQIEISLPNRYIYFLGGTQWGGSLKEIDIDKLVNIPKERIRYEIHKYVFSGDRSNYEADWDHSFGNHLDRVVIGEWALPLNSYEAFWTDKFIIYLKRKGIENTYYWTTANSHDTKNIFAKEKHYSSKFKIR